MQGLKKLMRTLFKYLVLFQMSKTNNMIIKSCLFLLIKGFNNNNIILISKVCNYVLLDLSIGNNNIIISMGLSDIQYILILTFQVKVYDIFSLSLF